MEVRELDAVAGGLPVVEQVGRGGNIQSALRKSVGEKAVDESDAGKKTQKIDPQMAEKVVEAMNDLTSAFNVRIAFSVDEGTGKTIIRVINKETKEVIRQIPPEEMLRLAAQMHRVLGMLLNEKA